MKKFTAFALLFGIWYLAGIYRNKTLMTAAICAAIAVLVLIVSARVMRHCISVKIPPQNRIAYKNTEKLFNVQAYNKGIIPVNRMSVMLNLKYKNAKKISRKKFYGSASGKKDNDSNLMGFYFIAPYCGALTLSVKKFRVYDWLSIFSSGKRAKCSEELFILPIDRNIQIQLPPIGTYDGDPVTMLNSDKKGNDNSEIRLIREYRQGDLYRHLHRNYTARTGTPWIKEYYKENDFVFDLLLDTSGELPPNEEDMDAFYDISYSVISALIKSEAIVRVHWYDKNKKMLASETPQNTEQLNHLMTRLYQTDTECSPSDIQGTSSELGKNKMVINTRLEWYFMEKHIFSFTKQMFHSELAGNIFVL